MARMTADDLQNQSIAANASNIASNTSSIMNLDRRLIAVDERVSQVAAMAAALSAVPNAPPGGDRDFFVGIGVGNSDGEQGVASWHFRPIRRREEHLCERWIRDQRRRQLRSRGRWLGVLGPEGEGALGPVTTNWGLALLRPQATSIGALSRAGEREGLAPRWTMCGACHTASACRRWPCHHARQAPFMAQMETAQRLAGRSLVANGPPCWDKLKAPFMAQMETVQRLAGRSFVANGLPCWDKLKALSFRDLVRGSLGA